MENPLELEAPEDPIERIHAFARDLAYGTVQKKWSAIDFANQDQQLLIAGKYGGNNPDLSTLFGFGYLEKDPIHAFYVVTKKAYQLLERPAVPPVVFIAYGSVESSAFGLACEYRLRSEAIPVFIDHSLVPGMKWNPQLEETIKNSKVMVCLLTAKTMSRSTYIQKEIKLARDSGLTFISIGHSGFNLDKHCSEELKPFVRDSQTIEVAAENAAAYHNAVEALVNALGFFRAR